MKLATLCYVRQNKKTLMLFRNKKKQDKAKEAPEAEAQETLNEEIERELNEAKGEER